MGNFKNYLTEKEQSVIFTFGRFNPITKGHQQNVNELISLGKKFNATPILFLSQSQDAKKNPLNFEDKVNLANRFFDIKVSTNAKLKTAYQILEDLGKQGYKTVYFVVGEDRVKEFGRMGGYAPDYGIENFEVVSSGARTKGVSGTDMRNYVLNDDFDSFKKNAPKGAKEDDIRKMFDLVKEGMFSIIKQDIS